MATKVTDIFQQTFPEAKCVVVSGDIHGDFNEIVFKMCVQYDMKDTSFVAVEAIPSLLPIMITGEIKKSMFLELKDKYNRDIFIS